jgi:hypothetical protein
VVKVTFPFLIASAGMEVVELAGPISRNDDDGAPPPWRRPVVAGQATGTAAVSR